MVTRNLATVMDIFCNRVTLTFDLLTSGLMHAERLPCSIRVPSLVLIAQAVFLLECGQTDRQTRVNAIPTPAAMPAWVMKQQQRLNDDGNTLYSCCFET